MGAGWPETHHAGGRDRDAPRFLHFPVFHYMEFGDRSGSLYAGADKHVGPASLIFDIQEQGTGSYDDGGNYCMRRIDFNGRTAALTSGSEQDVHQEQEQ